MLSRTRPDGIALPDFFDRLRPRWCGSSLHPDPWSARHRILSSRAVAGFRLKNYCAMMWCIASCNTMKIKIPIRLPCTHCQKIVTAKTKNEQDLARRGRAYCSVACKTEEHRKRSSETMARTNRIHASARMKTKNPMHQPKTREKVKTTLRAMQWGPTIRGGNGRGPTIQETLLACALGWETNVVVPTKMKRGSGYPTCYKIDVGNSLLKIGVEVDGFSHSAMDRQLQDRKKESFLNSIGWSVLRFSNQQVTERLAECVQTVLSTISK